MYIYTWAHTYLCRCVYIYTYIEREREYSRMLHSMCIHIYLCAYVQVYIYICIYTYIYIYICTDMYEARPRSMSLYICRARFFCMSCELPGTCLWHMCVHESNLSVLWAVYLRCAKVASASEVLGYHRDFVCMWRVFVCLALNHRSGFNTLYI